MDFKYQIALTNGLTYFANQVYPGKLTDEILTQFTEEVKHEITEVDEIYGHADKLTTAVSRLIN